MQSAIDISPIVCDIETAGLPNAADFLEAVVPDARLKDPEKIKADIAEKEAARLNKLELDWNVGRIVAIAWWTERSGVITRVCPSEIDENHAIREVWSECRRRTIVGFNVKGFDLKFMVQRSRYLGIIYPTLDLGKYTRNGIVDLFSELTFHENTYDKGAMRRTLHAFCRRFGIPVTDTTTGKNIAALVEAGDWQGIAAHVTSDIELTVALARKLNVIQPALVAAGV